MLRAKQLGTLSQSARSFILSGSRCSAADGSSCTCSEDETCVSGRPHRKHELPQRAISSPVVSRPSVAVGSLISKDAGKTADNQKLDVKHPVSQPQVTPVSSSIKRENCVNYADFDGTGVMHPSPPIADQFVKAGIAAVGFLSDLVSYKISMTDGGGILGSPQNSVVEQAKPIHVRASNVKTVRREKVHPQSHPHTTAGSSATNNSNASKGRADKSTSVKSTGNLSNNGMGNYVEANGIALESCDRKRSMPQRSKTYPSHFVPNVHNGEKKIVKDMTEGFARSVRETKVLRGVAPIAREFSGSGHVVDNVSHMLQQMKWGPVTEESLRKLNCSLDAFQANKILKQLQDYTVALGFFYWLKKQPGFKHDGHTYTTMVGILGRARQFGAINKLLDQMVMEGCQPNVVTYNRLIHSYGRANYLNEAINVFNKMQKAGCQPDRVTYCTLIDIHAKAGYLDVAMDMYQRMQEFGLSPDTFTYSVIINCLGKAGHLADAHKLFCEMVNQGCVPNLVTYNIMIALHAKARNYQNALQLYRDMQNAGFEPDKVTYSIVMEVLGHCGYLEEAEAVFAEMKRKNWVPDEPVYGLLVDVWGKVGNAEKAWEWYRAMLNAGLRPNVPTCNSLLSAFLRVHRLSDAYNLLQSMLSLGLNPSLQTYTLLLSCCTEAKTSFDMSFCCQLMAVTCHPAHMFLLSMPAAGPDGQNVRDHASNFLDFMHSEDRESKRGLVDAVVDFLHKTGLKEEAGSVWEVAAQKNVYPDAVREKSSCYWLINLHVMSDGTAVTALSRTLAWFRRQMLASGICPSRIDIVTGWGRRSRVTGSSLVRQAVQELLNVFSFPFVTENGNSGCFVGCGEPLSRWLVQSYVERMHLL
ncbi:pentatricopeptide repeat-containing protein At1g74750-like [Coffea arabica]|uniref:Pentatricopeptide repeat-containing protein At1g74750-like n=1 Tax=Coffea arabica TaxID=13443 RepID=A0A6P6X7X4_COFAR|nr:pentatricopeptide repeat-containing protein At1g74750-like [Coffea arabica]